MGARLARFGLLAVLGWLAVVGSSHAGALRTDFSKALVPSDEIVSGGPPPDGIPAIDRPNFVTSAEANAWLKPKEPVVALEISGEARAYPLQILMWHEIVNDTVGGRPVAVTYCPLCNSGLVFDRVVGGVTLDFGTSGKLYKSDLVMYDRQSHSLWAQMEGRAIVGERAGTRLAPDSRQHLGLRGFQGDLSRRQGVVAGDGPHACVRAQPLRGLRPPRFIPLSPAGRGRPAAPAQGTGCGRHHRRNSPRLSVACARETGRTPRHSGR